MAAVPTDQTEESPEEAAFRLQARAFLESVAQPKVGNTDLTTTLGNTDTSRESELAHVAASRAWQRTLADHGWAGIAWPKEYGGMGLTPKHARIFAQEESKFHVSVGMFGVALHMVGPTIMAHGTEEQKREFLPKILSGEHLWCQLYSEPGAGSDLAGLTTRAELDGEEYVVNGQKVWNSGAHYADWGILLARTNWDVPKHRGITYFLVDMRSPGIEVRPLRQITGHAHFNETFFTNVRIPAANVLGDLDAGWGVTQTTLMAERSMIGGGGGGVTFAAIAELARECGVTDDAVMRQELVKCYTRFEVLKWLGLRARAAALAGRPLGAESSVVKLAASQRCELDGNLLMAIEGAGGMLMNADAPAGGSWQQVFLGQWSIRIGGGTENIQRNVLGERVLGLPADIRVDKNVPFRDLPRN
jgi:alkylation response protein AidB-like acyl-CoA dehydrogenase